MANPATKHLRPTPPRPSEQLHPALEPPPELQPVDPAKLPWWKKPLWALRGADDFHADMLKNLLGGNAGLTAGGKGDDPGYGSEDERRRAIEEAQKILRDPSASQRDKSKAKRRIEELSRRRSKRAHGGDKLIAIDPTLDVISIQAPPRLGCRKVCE